MFNTPFRGIRICIIHFKCKHFGFLLFSVDISNLTVTLPAVYDRDIVLNVSSEMEYTCPDIHKQYCYVINIMLYGAVLFLFPHFYNMTYITQQTRYCLPK